MLEKFKLHYWPILCSVWFIATFVTSYLVSVLGENVYPFFPFISDTGALPPESCIFGQMLNIGAVFLAITFYIRYRQVGSAIYSNEIILHKRWNDLSFFCGLIASLGISVVGNFQETTVISVHFIGAFMAFGIGSVCIIMQTRISYAFRPINYKNPKFGVGRKLFYLRVVLTVLFIGFFGSTLVCGAFAVNDFNGDEFTWWTEEHGGFEARLGSTFSEWLMAICFMTYALSLTNEFKALEFEEIKFKSKYGEDIQKNGI